MILIADGGSTKTDWVAIDNDKNILFKIHSSGLNPAITQKEVLKNRIASISNLVEVKDKVHEVYFYGAGCGTPKPVEVLHEILQTTFKNAKINIAEDILAAVYASSRKKPAIVCILGTGSNSCYFNGKKIEQSTPSLGYTIMDEASGNYFGKKLIRDYFYKKMPEGIAKKFKKKFNLNPDFIKMNLYHEPNPNMYLASFAAFMIDFEDKEYIQKIIRKGFEEFFIYQVLNYKTTPETPIYFIGSIAFYFKNILEKVAQKYNLKITQVIQRPIDNLVSYHKENI